MYFTMWGTKSVKAVLLVLIAIGLLPLSTALADPTFANSSFQEKWQRADKPVLDGSSNPPRSWLWGPEGFNQSTEDYRDSPGGKRQVQYFDKARMELNNPSSGFVTNGLLVKELISGMKATGDANFFQRSPANIPIAGDPEGNNGPTYQSFLNFASLNNDKPATDQTGQSVNATISQYGHPGSLVFADGPPYNTVKVAYFEPTLKHNIPDVFWKFMNQRGNVFVNGNLLADQPVLGTNPAAPWLDATGFPITEAYWTIATVNGKAKRVLVQAFERRVLTFTPSNDPAFQVEMGNVGRHYFQWLNDKKFDLALPDEAGCGDVPANEGDLFLYTDCGPAGMEIVADVYMQPDENIKVVVSNPDKELGVGQLRTDKDGFARLVLPTSTKDPTGYWAIIFTGFTSKLKAVAYLRVDAPVDDPTVIVRPAVTTKEIGISYEVIRFVPKEALTFTFTGPNGIRATFSTLSPTDNRPILANSNGSHSGGASLSELVKLSGKPDNTSVVGDWTLTVVSNSRTAKATFKVIS